MKSAVFLILTGFQLLLAGATLDANTIFTRLLSEQLPGDTTLVIFSWEPPDPAGYRSRPGLDGRTYWKPDIKGTFTNGEALLLQLIVGGIELELHVPQVPVLRGNYRNIHFVELNMNTPEKFLPLVCDYADGAQGLIFLLIDYPGDPDKMVKWRNETSALRYMLSQDSLRDVPLLIFSINRDPHDKLSDEQTANLLGLNSYGIRKWHIQPCLLVSSDDILQGIHWLADTLSKSR